MSDAKGPDPTGMPPTAEQLRMNALQKQLAELESQQKVKEREERQLSEFTTAFLKSHVTEEEIAMVRRLVANAVEQGKYEAMVYSFPSNLCNDSGRAINSANRDWPETLQGKAKEFYERYLTQGKPYGYTLKAMVINFPGGMPGDIGFFLGWAPPAGG